jgi:Ca-activated chloride channel family protein
MHLLVKRGLSPVAAVLAGIATLGAGFVAAQDETVFRADTRLVVLHATVVDKNGKFIGNLPQSAFKVFENGKEQQIKIFKREDVPVSMGILIDDSGSMRDKRAKVAAASMGLVKASNPNDETFVVNFNDIAYLDVPFTNDPSKMEEGLSRIDSRGGTAMRDAIGMSIDYTKSKGKKDKKVLFIVTDGNDTASNETLERTVQRVRQSEVLIYAIALLNEEEAREAKKAQRALRALTDATGGQVYYPKELAEVEPLALRVAQEIRNQYIIAYSPAIQELDGSFRQIKVTVNGPGRPQVRTRNGYFATPGQDSKRAAAAPAAPAPAR